MDYDSIASGYDELHKEEQLKKLRIIRDNIPVEKEDRLLDVGCGTGFSLDFFDCGCTGVEPSKEMIAQSANKSRIVLGRAENLPFEDNSFDVVISVTAIHNFEDIEKGLKEMKRVGKDRFAFSVLKKAKTFDRIKKLIFSLFTIKKEIEEDKDVIFMQF
jgi:ubiquinone/menaquinone biosynthesis C-methylase UbiE